MKKHYYNTCKICGSNLDPGEKCNCNALSTTLIDGDILYLCDRRACSKCSPMCNHTRDITHAQNFESTGIIENTFTEKE